MGHICGKCEGDGEIVFNDSPINDPQCEDAAPCWACGGSGTCDGDLDGNGDCYQCAEHVEPEPPEPDVPWDLPAYEFDR